MPEIMEVKIFDPCPLHGMLESRPYGTVRLPITVAEDERASYYAIPGLKLRTSLLEIKQAYRDLVQIWHPDRFSNNTRLQKRAEKQIKVINAAHSQLTNRGGSAIDTSSASEAFHTKRGPSQSYDSHQDQSGNTTGRVHNEKPESRYVVYTCGSILRRTDAYCDNCRRKISGEA